MNVKGSFTIHKSNKLGSTAEYRLIFLDDRLLFVKTGGLFAAEDGIATFCSIFGIIVLSQIGLILYGIIGLLLLGAIAGGLSGFFISFYMKRRKKKIDQLTKLTNINSIEQIIQTNKNNFSIPYSEIVNMQITNADRYSLKKGLLAIEAKTKYEFDIRDRQPFEIINTLVQKEGLGK